MKTENLLLLAVAGLAIYYFFFKKDGSADWGGGGGGGGGTPDALPSIPPVTTTLPTSSGTYYYRAGGSSTGNVIPTSNVREVHAAAGSRQRWTGVSYGQPGQPSAAFGRRVAGSTAVRAGAPPRVVAKIKAGKWY